MFQNKTFIVSNNKNINSSIFQNFHLQDIRHIYKNSQSVHYFNRLIENLN